MLLSGTAVTTAPAQAAACPSVSVGGPAVGWVTTDGAQVPIKPVTYPAGGELDPPASALVAGVSMRHRPLLSKSGTTVLTWHVRYGKGCDGALNDLMTAPIGERFSIAKNGGGTIHYAITERVVVPKGAYRPEWFQLDGSPQVAMFTCTGLKNGTYTKTMAIIAEPVTS